MQRLTDRSAIRALCEKHGFALSKGLGQHFLVNPGICPKLCEAAGITPGDGVLEIGPGFGTLTRELAARAARVAALEVDGRLLPVLAETLKGVPNVRVLRGDALKEDLAALLAREFGGGRVVVCANLPYYITTPILMRLLEERLPVASITVMVQREAAVRLTAEPGTREAGAVSCAVRYHATAKTLFTVEAGSFYPPPAVASAVIRLDIREKRPLQGEPAREARLFRLVRAAFGQRRKTLANAACPAAGLPKDAICAALRSAGLPAFARAEQLTLSQYIALEKALWPYDEI